MPLQDGGKEWDCPQCGKDSLFDCVCGYHEPRKVKKNTCYVCDGKGSGELDNPCPRCFTVGEVDAKV